MTDYFAMLPSSFRNEVLKQHNRAWEVFPNLLFAERWFFVAKRLGLFKFKRDGD